MAEEVRRSVAKLLDMVRLEEGVYPGDSSEGTAHRRRRDPSQYVSTQNEDFLMPTRDKSDPSDLYRPQSPFRSPALSLGSPMRVRTEDRIRDSTGDRIMDRTGDRTGDRIMDKTGDRTGPHASPLRASHALGLSSLHGDTDSGISTRLRPSFSSLSPRIHNTVHDSLTTSRSYDHHSPRSSRSFRRLNTEFQEQPRSPSPLLRPESSPSRAPSAERKVSDLQMLLEESEQRRVLLTQKLKDAQDIIEAQTSRLRAVELSVKDKAFSLEDLKHREGQLQKKVSAAEKERDEQQRRRLEEARASRKLHDKIEGLENTVLNTRLHTDQLQAEADKKKDAMDSVTSTLTLLEQENAKLSQAKASFAQELSAIKEALDIARSRNTWVESHSKDTHSQIERLTQRRHFRYDPLDNMKLAEDNHIFGVQLTEIKKHNLLLKEESSTLSTTMQGLKDERCRVDHELGRLRASLADMQASLASTTCDKERYFREKLDLHQKVQQVQHERDALIKSKQVAEGQLGDLQGQVTGARRDLDKAKAKRLSAEEQLVAVKKVGAVLSTELANTRSKLEKATGQALGMEQTNKLTVKQQQLCQQEVHSLENQVETLKKSMENLHKDNSKEKDCQEAHQIKLKEEVRHLKAERNQLELKLHELEARMKQCDTKLLEQDEVGRREVGTWKREAEKVTASLGRRDAEVEELQNKVTELEDELSGLLAGRGNQQAQYEELLESREELMRLREENRRIFQERGENQQVIQLLEMQKNILSKMSESNMEKAHDAEQLQCKVDRLAAENCVLQDKSLEIEKLRDALLKEKEDRLRCSSDDDGDDSPGPGPSPAGGRGRRGGRKQVIIDDLQQQNEQLQKVNAAITEQLTRFEQENSAMRIKQGDMLQRSEFQKVEAARLAVEHDLSMLRAQHAQLEQRHHDVIAERYIAECEEVSVARREQGAVEARLALVKGDLVLAENAKSRLEERAEGLERQLEQATARTRNSMRDREQVVALELRVAQLTSDLEAARKLQSQQEQLVTSLREQSLDDVGHELTDMRTELQKLLEVIQEKDQAIEHLEARLEDSRREVQDRERTIEQMTSSVQSGGDLQGLSQRTDNDTSALCEEANTCSESTKTDLLKIISELENERDELRAQADALFKERDLALQDAADLRDGLDDLEQMFDEDRVKLQEKYRKEIRAKERQIEALEEQLRSSTNYELRKLKRDAGRVELLRTENRILQNQLSWNCHSSSVHTSFAANPDYPVFIAPTEEDPPDSLSPEILLKTTSSTIHPAPPLVSTSHSNTDEDSSSSASSISINVLKETFEVRNEIFDTIATEQDINEAIALLGGISLADLEPPSPPPLLPTTAPPTAKCQEPAQIQNGHHMNITVEDDVMPEPEQPLENEQGDNFPGDELTLADLESDIESTDHCRIGAVPGSSRLTRALRLADLDHQTSDTLDYSLDHL